MPEAEGFSRNLHYETKTGGGGEGGGGESAVPFVGADQGVTGSAGGSRSFKVGQ